MPLNRSKEPFSSPDWIYELKYDGFRALAEIEYGRCRLVSRNGNAFFHVHGSRAETRQAVPNNRVILDGEIVCLDERGRPRFKLAFMVFDLLFDTGTDLRQEQVTDRKAALWRLLRHICRDEPLMYVDHVEQHGEALVERVCKLDLEGIVAKLKSGPYVAERDKSTWRKILNPNYSQRMGREELFERDRQKEPVAGWHSCVVACAELEEAVEPVLSKS